MIPIRANANTVINENNGLPDEDLDNIDFENIGMVPCEICETMINFNDYNLVTGSAFLDILPKSWFKNFHKLNVDTEIVYFALNYNGNFKFFPKHKDDKKILNIFNKDQKSDKGIGKVAVGPDCTELINKVFKRTHKTYVLDSTWDVSKNYEFQIYFLNFCREIIQKNKLNFDDWLKFRLRSIKEKNSRFILNNTDFLAIKK